MSSREYKCKRHTHERTHPLGRPRVESTIAGSLIINGTVRFQGHAHIIGNLSLLLFDDAWEGNSRVRSWRLRHDDAERIGQRSDALRDKYTYPFLARSMRQHYTRANNYYVVRYIRLYASPRNVCNYNYSVSIFGLLRWCKTRLR